MQDTVKQRDSSLDSFARAMSELAASSKAQFGNGTMIPIVPAGAAQTAAPAVVSAPAAGSDAIVTIEDSTKCTNCKTCYQDISEIFEKTRIVVNGESREVARIIPGVLERITVTPELKSRIQRVSANCDAEIIR